MLVCFLYALIVSWRWPVIHDAAIMHYVVFLMDHGMAPYRDIVDINMPGAYLTEWLAVHLLGPGDLAWRVFDLLEMLVATAACCVLARRVDWRAGLLAGLLLSVAHMANGAIEVGQRDWTITVLLLAGYACLLLALQRAQPAWMAAFALACGAAAAVKPLAAPIPFFLLGITCLNARQQNRPLRPYLLWSGAGTVLAAAVFFGFLAAYHVTADFFAMLRGSLAFYTSVGNKPYPLMAQLALGRYITALLAATLGFGIWLRGWRNPEQLILLSGILFGAALYFGQHKGWSYHRLTLLAFALLWMSRAAYDATCRRGAVRWAGAGVLVLLLIYAADRWTREVQSQSFDDRMQNALQRDLQAAGGSSLSGSVQCLEMGNGCITDLYRMRLVQSTGFLSDFFLFAAQPQPALEMLRAQLLHALMAHPPRAIVVVASDWAGGAPVFQPTQNWPAFAAWLQQRYRLAAERLGAGGAVERGSYRLYLLR